MDARSKVQTRRFRSLRMMRTNYSKHCDRPLATSEATAQSGACVKNTARSLVFAHAHHTSSMRPVQAPYLCHNVSARFLHQALRVLPSAILSSLCFSATLFSPLLKTGPGWPSTRHHAAATTILSSQYQSDMFKTGQTYTPSRPMNSG